MTQALGALGVRRSSGPITRAQIRGLRLNAVTEKQRLSFYLPSLLRLVATLLSSLSRAIPRTSARLPSELPRARLRSPRRLEAGVAHHRSTALARSTHFNIMSNTASYSTNHPQLEIHELSLLGKEKPQATHHDPERQSAPGIKTVGNADAQAFWLNAAKSIDWIKPPTVAHGIEQRDLVSVGMALGGAPPLTPSM